MYSEGVFAKNRAERTKYEWENPVYNLVFQNPFMFNEPIPIRYNNYGTYFRVAMNKKDLLNSHKVHLLRPHWEGTCLKMPAADFVLQEIDNGIDSISFDLCDTNVDYYFDSESGESYPIENIDFIGRERTIHKKVVSVQLGHYVDENKEPVYFRGYDTQEDKIWQVLSYFLE